MKHKNNFFKRLFISSVLLLIYTVISTYSNISLKFISKPMNITHFGNILIGTFNDEFKNKTTQTSTIIFDQIKYQNDENIIFSSTNSVINLKPGIVIKIEKKDSLYNVTIQTKNNLYYQYVDTIMQYNKDSYGKNLNDKKNYSVSFIVNSYYREIKYLEHITFKLRQRLIRDINNSFSIIKAHYQFPVEKELLPFQPKHIRVYNDLIDTGEIYCDSIDKNTGMPKNNVENYQTPYWDLGNWNFSFLRDVEHYPNADYENPESRLFGNYFVISFDFGNVDTLIEFENLDVQLSKDKNL